MRRACVEEVEADGGRSPALACCSPCRARDGSERPICDLTGETGCQGDSQDVRSKIAQLLESDF